MITDMRYAAIPLVAILFSLFFATSAFAAEGTICTQQYAPVCAAQQVQCIKAPCYPVYRTYGNACMAGTDDAKILHQGECTSAESGPIKPSTEAYQPPAGCTAWYDGCNSCSRQGDGTAVCTLRACLVQEAGYCTEYASTTTPPVAATSTDATTFAPTTPVRGPLASFWHWVLHLLGF